jgi:nucleoporin p58/p45
MINRSKVLACLDRTKAVIRVDYSGQIPGLSSLRSQEGKDCLAASIIKTKTNLVVLRCCEYNSALKSRCQLKRSSGSLNASQNQQTQQQQQQQQQPGGLFGSLNRPAQPLNANAFGNSLGGLKMGQSQAQTVPGVRIDVSQMKGTTRFNDLHEDLQKQIENIDKIILAQQALCADCEAIMPSHANQLSSIPSDVDFVSRKLIGVESSLEADAEAVALVGQLVKSDAENAKLSFKAIDNLKLPPQYHQGNWIANSAVNPSSQSQDSGAPQDLVSFFSQTADEMSATLQKYQDYISEIEQHLRSVEAATMMQAQQLNGNGHGDNIGQQQRELAAVLREFEAGIRRVAGEVAEARGGVEGLLLGSFVDHSDRKAPGSTRRIGIY